jgi:intracellular multiplication protein IcmL
VVDNSTPLTDTDKSSGSRPLDTVITRNIFYRDGYRNLVKLAIIQGLVILVLIISLAITIAVSRPQDRFFATTSDGRLIRMIPLNESNMTDAAIISWAARASSDVMTFGFHDHQKRLQETSIYFTRRGWQSFTEALSRARIIESVEANQQVVTAAPQRAPVIVQQGLVAGIYRWILEVPLVVTYQSGTAQQSSNLTINMVIVRVSTLDNPAGVGIQQWVAR